jgi:hypothetical protein
MTPFAEFHPSRIRGSAYFGLLQLERREPCYHRQAFSSHTPKTQTPRNGSFAGPTISFKKRDLPQPRSPIPSSLRISWNSEWSPGPSHLPVVTTSASPIGLRSIIRLTWLSEEDNSGSLSHFPSDHHHAAISTYSVQPGLRVRFFDT